MPIPKVVPGGEKERRAVLTRGDGRAVVCPHALLQLKAAEKDALVLPLKPNPAPVAALDLLEPHFTHKSAPSIQHSCLPLPQRLLGDWSQVPKRVLQRFSHQLSQGDRGKDQQTRALSCPSTARGCTLGSEWWVLGLGFFLRAELLEIPLPTRELAMPSKNVT